MAVGHTLTSYATVQCKKPHGKSSQGAGELPPVRYIDFDRFWSKCNAYYPPKGATSRELFISWRRKKRALSTAMREEEASCVGERLQGEMSERTKMRRKAHPAQAKTIWSSTLSRLRKKEWMAQLMKNKSHRHHAEAARAPGLRRLRPLLLPPAKRNMRPFSTASAETPPNHLPLPGPK